jgi:hypothetical protein
VVQPLAHGRYGRAIATWDDVERIALALPRTEKGTTWRAEAWKVAGKPKPRAFAWVRPLSQNDIRQLTELGRQVERGEILAVRTAGQPEKQAVLEQFSEFVFDIPHFANHSGVLVKLDMVPLGVLEDLIVDAWLALAPRDLAAAYLESSAPP